MTDVRFGTATDVGSVREANEDAMLAEPPVFVVADGMGGHAHGEVASALVVDHLRGLAGHERLTVDEVTEAVDSLNAVVQEAAWESPALGGMGTTVVGVVVVEHEGAPCWLAFNIGDSRLYRFAAGVLEQVSVDHSLVQELLDAGQITARDIPDHPQRSVITRVLGTAGPVEPDFWLLPLEGRLLLCSDGLSTEVDDGAIAELLAERADLQEAADALVAAALAAGGRDNVTVVVVDV